MLAHHPRTARVAAAVALLTLLGTGCTDLATGASDPDPASTASPTPEPDEDGSAGADDTQAPTDEDSEPSTDEDSEAPADSDGDTPGEPAPSTPPGQDGAAEVQVGLTEWSVTPDAPSVAAGEVTFTADNVGRAPHELVVVRANSLDDLPLDGDGAVDEDALDPDAVVGEIEGIASETSKAATFDLEAGRYALICNLVRIDGEFVESHYQFGMATGFEVTSG